MTKPTARKPATPTNTPAQALAHVQAAYKEWAEDHYPACLNNEELDQAASDVQEALENLMRICTRMQRRGDFDR